MEKKLLTFLKKNPRRVFSSRELSKALFVPPEARREFRNFLKALSSQGLIARFAGGRFGLAERANEAVGLFRMHRDGYGFVLSEDSRHPDIFIPDRRRGDAWPGDLVRATFETNEQKRREGTIVEVLKRGRPDWVGKFEKRGRSYVVVNQEFSFDVEIGIPKDRVGGAEEGQLVVVRILTYPSDGRYFTGEVVGTLGDAQDEEGQVRAICVRNAIPLEFPEAVLAEMNGLEAYQERETLREPSRVDLTHLPFITIDGLSARDFDDAVCVIRGSQGTILYVSIADVAHYVRPETATDDEAFSRGTSVYFPDKAIPMLPERLSNDLCSLKQGVERPTLTCEMHFSNDGKLKRALYYSSVIRSRVRATYDEAQSFFDGSTESMARADRHVLESLREMKKLAHELLKQRSLRGSVDFDLPEASIVYGANGEVVAIARAKRFFAHQLIEEFMIAANVAVGTLFARQEIPLLYRVHDKPDATKLSEFVRFAHNCGLSVKERDFQSPSDLTRFLKVIDGHPMEPLLHQLLLRSMKQATYDSDNRGHYGLNLENYCHFTSPIRRYPDLLVHRQLKTWLGQNEKGIIELDFRTDLPVRGKKMTSKEFYSHSLLGSMGKTCSRRERSAMEAEREVLDLKRALFMQKRVGKTYEGVVRRIAKFGLFVELSPHFVDGLLSVRELKDDYYLFDEKKMRLIGRRRKKTFRIGDPVRVRVANVSIANRQVELELG